MRLIQESVQLQGRTLRAQSGAALLVFVLLLIVSTSTLLLTKLNAGIRGSVYNPSTNHALQEAKEALVAWAVNHPVNPGTLPMPDRNGDSNYDGDSDCYNGGPIGNNLLTGKLSWRGYASPCIDSGSIDGLSVSVVDKSGEQLWYAVSKNLVYESPDYPFISPAYVNKSSGWITVRNSNGGIISDRVAFVVISPGPALLPYSDCDGLSYTGQDRSGDSPDIEHYLDSVLIDGETYSNADYNQEFIIYPDSTITSGTSTQEKCDRFNDQLVFVTIDELVDAVSVRALNETANALTAYHNANNAFPWLSPFADPKSEPKSLHGEATSSSSNLIDTSVDFNEWGVTNGDAVWNLTDGSMGKVTSVAANTLSIGAGLNFGTNNTFTAGDEYFVEVRYMPSVLMGTASGGSTGNTLRDTGRDFGMLGLVPGDIIENLDDGSSGIISDIDDDEITSAGLEGGANDEFSSGDDYRIRTNTSRVTGTTINEILTDENVDFIAMGVRVGDLVHNLWDQTISRVASIDSATQLTVDVLKLGTGTRFDYDEPYQISRYNSMDGTRIGLLPIHQLGELIPTGFSVDWNSPNSGGSVTTTLATDSIYTDALENYASTSSGHSGTVTVDEMDAKCLWISPEIVRCKGIYEDTNADFLAGTATTGSSSLALRDSSKDFSILGTKRGDKVRNTTDGTTGIVFYTSTSQLNLVNISGYSPVDFSVGDDYEIDLATSSFTFYAVTPSSSYSTRVYYPGTVDESLLSVGDTIENMNGLTSIGRIESINTGSNYIVHTPLTGGGYADIYATETVRIRHNFVDRRRYDFDVTMKGTAAENPVNDVRKRSICKGYDTGCSTALNDATLKGDGTTAFVTIRDYEGTTEVGKATNILPLGGLTGRSLKVSNLDFYLDDNYGDLPEWFVRNKWYQYVMVAYSDGDAPGGTTCVAGTNCLTLNLRDADATIAASRDNVRALVMVSREELAGQSWADAAETDYFDDPGNISLGDESFEKYRESDTFNDLIRIAESCPSTEELCWSN